MNTYICMNCNHVFMAGASYAKCCGEIEEFSPEKHGELLVGLSNSWISVWKKWKDNPLLTEISNQLMDEGCYGAASHLNAFIERLMKEYQNNIKCKKEKNVI